MRRIIFILLAFCACVGFISAARTAHAAGRVEFILDSSGSMNAKMGTERKIDVARNALTAAISETPEGNIAALRIYGHRIPNNKKAESCKDSELAIPFGPIDKAAFLAAMNRAKPLGQTPIAYSLQLAAQDFGKPGDEVATIILVSDGEETCGGDPVAVVKGLIAKGFKIKVNTIGFDVDPKARAQLQALATATGGLYRDARDSAGLAATLKELAKESFVINKSKAEYGEPIKGGDSYENAVPLERGKLYRLTHHQRKNEYDYFYVDLVPGQELKASIQTGDQGIEIRGDKAAASAYPYAGVEIHNSAHQKVAGENIIGDRNATKTATLFSASGQGGRYYVLLGNTYDDQSKDSPFKIDVVNHFDAGTQQDAPDTQAGALPVDVGENAGFLGPGDQADMYKFSAAAGTSYEIKARPASDKLKLTITVTDSDGVVLASQSAQNEGAAVRIDSLTPQRAGDIFIKFASVYSDVPPSDYTFSIAQATASATAAGAQGALPSVAQQPAAMPMQPAVPAATEATTAVAGKPSVADVAQLKTVIRSLPLGEGMKFYLIFCIAPFATGLIIGLVWGYAKGRRRIA